MWFFCLFLSFFGGGGGGGGLEGEWEDGGIEVGFEMGWGGV